MSYLKNLGEVKLAILALIFVNIIWGASFPVYKWSLDYIPPFTFIVIRFLGAAIVLLPFAYKRMNIERQDIKYLFLISFLAITIQIPLLIFGLRLTPSINAPIIIAIAPLIIIAASILFLNEKLKLKVLAGTLISLFGVVLIILRPMIETGGLTGSVLGNLMIFGFTLCFVAQSILLRKLTVRNDPLGITVWMFFIGIIPLVPFMLYELQTYNILTISSQALIGVGFGIFFAAALAHIGWAYGLKYIKASEAGIFSYIEPIATVFVAVPLLGEKITYAYIFGSILVFTGIFIAEGRLHYHKLNKSVEK